MAKYFNRTTHPFCPSTGQDHRTIKEVTCPGCELRNPEFRYRPPIPPDAEIIAVGDDSPI
jgi:hypothetical protein